MASAVAQQDLFLRPVPSFLAGLDEEIQAISAYGLRYYQRAAKEAIQEAWETVRSVLLVMATGTGKTRTFGAVAGEFDGRVLVLAHRDELVQQAVKALEAITGEMVGVEQAGFRSGRERIVVGSTQTVQRDNRLERLSKMGGFNLVIADEAHHYLAPTYRKILEHFSSAKILGVTATPDRGDAKALGQIFDAVAYEFDIEQAIEAGYLVPVVGERVYLEEIDLSGVDTSKGDLNITQLDEVMIKAVEGIVKIVLERWPNSRGPAFFPRKRSAEYAAERFNAIKPGCAAVITDDTEKEDRREIIRACHRGEIQFLCNCMVATEGFDWPEADLMVGGRPTKSRALFAQMVGRVTRVLPGLVDGIDGPEMAEARRTKVTGSRKPHCTIADFVGNAGKHSLISVEDVLGGRYSEVELKEAKKRAEKDGGGDPRKHLQAARLMLQEMARATQSKVTAQVEMFNPFDVLHMKHDFARDKEMAERYGEQPATEKQLALLELWNIPNKYLHGLSKNAASKLIGTCQVRRTKGLASFWQLNKLQQFGVTNVNISFDRAKAAIRYLEQKGYGKRGFVDPHVLRQIIDNGGP